MIRQVQVPMQQLDPGMFMQASMRMWGRYAKGHYDPQHPWSSKRTTVTSQAIVSKDLFCNGMGNCGHNCGPSCPSGA